MEEAGVRLAINSFEKWTMPQIKLYIGKCIEILADYNDDGETVDQLHSFMDNIRSLEASEAAKRAEDDDGDEEEE
jgi:hypothetical protein